MAGTFAVVTKNRQRFVIGAFAQQGIGWRFIPYDQHMPSRRAWPTPEAALPRWAKTAAIVQAENVSEAVRGKESISGGTFGKVQRGEA
jgi:hypothetical protein